MWTMGTPKPTRRRRVTEGPKRAAIYARISDARDDDTAGVERQVEDCRRLAADRGLEVVGEYVDNNRSAFSGRVRPEYERMLDDVAAGRVDVIVVWATDRLYRRLADLEQLVEELHGVDVATCHSGEVELDTADGRLKARLLGSVAQHSSEKSGERVARAAEQRARRGGFNGGKRRFGYTADGAALVDAEVEALRWAYRHILDGGSVASVTREWTARGLTGPSGARLADPSVRDYLLRPMNAGIATYRGAEVGRTGMPVVVDEATWRAVSAILRDPSRRTTVGRPAKTLLTPFLRCAECKGPMSGGTRSEAAGKPRRAVYLCRKGCTQRSRPMLDEAVGTLVVAYLEREGLQLDAATGDDGSRLAREAEALRLERAELEAAFTRGDLDVAAYALGIRANNARREAMEARSVATSSAPAEVRQVAAADDVGAAWKAAPVDVRREVIRIVIERIEVGRNPAPGTFDFSAVSIVWRAVS